MGVIGRFVSASLQVEGVHQWDDAPEQVGYLRYPHRHMFHIEVHVQVFHNDRDTEIIQLKQKVRKYLAEKYYLEDWSLCNFGRMSCEMIAEELCIELKLERCSVKEDGENGGVIIYKHSSK